MVNGIKIMHEMTQCSKKSNVDEAEKLGKREVAAILFCSVVYTGLGYLMKWFDRNYTATLCFFFYMLFCYSCIWLIYMIKRMMDTAFLNQELEQFKNRKNLNKE
ncbi:MAG: DUF3021 family protein [Lachnospiraceae bacterium]|nr:DUF3021 family protein [Lachnospiraceae bacterium]